MATLNIFGMLTTWIGGINKIGEIPEDTIQNMGIHVSITGKTMMRIIFFDHKTTAATPLLD